MELTAKLATKKEQLNSTAWNPIRNMIQENTEYYVYYMQCILTTDFINQCSRQEDKNNEQFHVCKARQWFEQYEITFPYLTSLGKLTNNWLNKTKYLGSFF